MVLSPVLLLAGPTASGKSDLALRLAERLGGQIVNGDSMQVYGDLPILSAMPSLDDQAKVAHHLYGHVPVGADWSVGTWLRAVLPQLSQIRAQGLVPIVVGGTGLYFSALTKGLADIPSVPHELRALIEAELTDQGEAAFRKRLLEVDPAAEARIMPGDRQRLIRALAVHRVSGRALSAWQAETRPDLAPDDWRGIILDPPRDWLHRRCNLRFEQMLEAGALDEVAALKARTIAPGAGVLRTLGFRELSDHLGGLTDLATAKALAQAASRQYAKRQCTWFRNQTPDWARVEVLEVEARLAAILG